MFRGWPPRAWLALALVALLAEGAAGDLLHTTIGARVIAFGGHCDKAPDELIPAPNSNGGFYERHFGDYVFVVEGDRFPARKSMGLGVRVVLPGYGPGSPVTVLIEAPGERPNSWDVTVDPDGEVEFGTFPPDGEALRPGLYLLSVLDRGHALMTFSFIVEREADDGLCVPAVS
jgi:hypothetical protein